MKIKHKRLIQCCICVVGVSLLSGCAQPYTWVFQEKGEEVIMSSGKREIIFEKKGALSKDYRVLSLSKKSPRIAKDNGVCASLFGIPLEMMPEDRPFTPNDLNKREHFSLIPANEGVRATLSKLCSKKRGCWKKVFITGERLIKVAENNEPSRLDLSFFYVREIKGSW